MRSRTRPIGEGRKPIYYDERAAKEAGFVNVPAPPTYLIAAATWGSFIELQRQPPGPDLLGDVGAECARQGGLLLHGEQSFTFERLVIVGDVLDTETEIVDTYVRGRMTFTIAETRFSGASTGVPVALARFNMINRQ